MTSGDLTTVAKARTHLGITSSGADEVLAAYVTSSSKWVLSQLGRPIHATTVTETRDGDDSIRMRLEKCPATGDDPPLAVTSVTVDGTAVPARPAVSSTNSNPDGWALNRYAIDLVNYTFTRGLRNVVIVYRTGYETTEAATIPAAGPYTVQAAATWRGDVGVTIAGVSATKVTGTPTAGQYAVSTAVGSEGLYTFAAANAGAAVVLSYVTTPEDLELAVLEHVAIRYLRRGNAGQGSASAGGEAVSYSDAGDWRSILDTLDRYRAMGLG